MDLINSKQKGVKIERSWKQSLFCEFKKEYFQKLSEFLRTEYLSGAVYPPTKDVFKAFDLCTFDKVKVVIIGQDPYHGAHQANGLSFAVQEGMSIPPSLRNIFLEIQSDMGIIPEQQGDLSRWAKQGVLLLNATLTVRAHTPGSHQKKGWEEFTDAAIQALSDKREYLVFVLWGNYAKQKGAIIDRSKHLVIESPHPSPFSAHSGFFGSKPFSIVNDYLVSQGLTPIDWK